MSVLSKTLVVAQRWAPVKRGFSKALERAPRDGEKLSKQASGRAEIQEPWELILFHVCLFRGDRHPLHVPLSWPALGSHPAQVLSLPTLTASRERQSDGPTGLTRPGHTSL